MRVPRIPFQSRVYSGSYLTLDNKDINEDEGVSDVTNGEMRKIGS